MGAVEILRDALFGNPPSPTYKPSREGVLAAFTDLSRIAQGAAAGLRFYSTKAALTADTTQPLGTLAYVYDDATPSNNTVYHYEAGGWVVDDAYFAQVASVVQPLVDRAEAAETGAETARDQAVAASTDAVIGASASVNRALPAARNIFDKSQAADNMAVQATNGVVIAGTGFYATGFIPVVPGGSFTANQAIFGNAGQYGVAFYTAAQTFIAGSGIFGGVAANTPVSVPAGAFFARFSGSITGSPKGSLYVVNGSTAPGAYRSFELVDRSTARVDAGDAIAYRLRRAPNLFNKARATVDSYIERATGNVVSSSGFVASDFMPVVGGRSYTPNFSYAGGGVAGTAFYDADFVFIVGVAGMVAGTAIVPPAGASYMRVTANTVAGRISVPDALMISEGTAIGEYAAAGYTDDARAARIAGKAVRAGQPAVVDLFDYRRVTPSTLIDINGVASSVGAYFTTDFVPVTGGGLIFANKDFVPGNPTYGWIWYDRDRNQVGATAGGYSANVGVSVPSSAAYGRTSGNTSDLLSFTLTDTAAPLGSAMLGNTDLGDTKPWLGLKIALGGDSIMQAGAAGGINAFQLGIQRALRANAVIQAGVSGRKVREMLNGSPANGNTPFVAADFDGISLWYANAGTNDFGIWNGSAFADGRPLGVLGDAASAGTFYGDLQMIYGDKLATWNPKMRLAMSTPIPRFDHGATGNPTNNLGLKLSDYADAIIAFGAKYAIPVLDLFRMVGFNVYNQGVWYADGLHPNLAGYRENMTPIVTRWLNTLR